MPVPVSLSEAKAAVHGVSDAYHYPRGGNLDYDNHLHNAMLELMKASDFFAQLEREQEQQEPSMLELRGAIDLLEAAKKKLHFHFSGSGAKTQAEKEADQIILMARLKVSEQYRALFNPVKRCSCCGQPIP